MVNKTEEEADHSGDAPPVLGSWNKIYSLVFIVLIALIIFLYFFSKAFD